VTYVYWLQVLAKSGFRFKKRWAGLLPGSSEGIYGFVAANYLSGALQKPLVDPDSLLGVVELGGASLQVTLRLPPPPPTVAEIRQLSFEQALHCWYLE